MSDGRSKVSVEPLDAAIGRWLVRSRLQLSCAHIVEKLSNDPSHEILTSVAQDFRWYRMLCDVVLQAFEHSVRVRLGDGYALGQ